MNTFIIKVPNMNGYGQTTEGMPYLQYGTMLQGRYVIDHVIGSGGFGVTYQAWDYVLNCPVAIKEYFPKDVAGRRPGETVMSVYTDQAGYEFSRGINRFLQEAQELARFNQSPGIVSVFDFFSENNTAYMVMEYLEGCTLKQYLSMNGEKVDLQTGMYIINNLLPALQQVHQGGLIHRDISPDNIFICTDSSIKLLDFGAAKETVDLKDQTVSVILKHGFAPPEQYMSKAQFGPWTDIYALGATVYRMFTGIMPMESVGRMVTDTQPQPRFLNPEIPQYINDAIMKAMAVKVEDRFHSVEDFQKALNGEEQDDTKKMIRKIVIICAPILCAAILVCVLIGVLGNDPKKPNTNKGNETSYLAKEKETTTEAVAAQEETTTEEKSKSENQPKENNTKPQTVGAQALPMPAEDSAPIYVYSWNTEVGERLQYVRDKYPQYADLILYENLGLGGTSDEYMRAIENAISNGGEKVPSIVAYDVDVAKRELSADTYVALADIGITDAMYSQAYQYTIDYGTVDGQLKGMCWQATPGCFVYRTDIAQEVLGTSDPAAVQSYVKDWDTFMDTAQKMKDAGYKMLSGTDDISKPVFGQKDAAWVNQNVFSVDSSVTRYFELAKRLYDNGYTNNNGQWTDGWNTDFTNDVFGYFGCPWFVYWSINDEEGSGTYGKRNICQGPSAYFWGGTYLGVTNQCTNKELAALVLYTLCCDTDVMYQLSDETLDYVNNKAAVDKMIADGLGSAYVLGNQDVLSIWQETAKKIDGKNYSIYDIELEWLAKSSCEMYKEGMCATAEEAVNDFKAQVRDQNPNLTVP